MRNLITDFLRRQAELAREIEGHFEIFFKDAAIPLPGKSRTEEGVVAHQIAGPDLPPPTARTFDAITKERGLYVILTDYAVPGADACRFHSTFPALRAIYRGHSFNIRERVLGHLLNSEYIALKQRQKQKPWGGYLKIRDGVPGDGGIDLLLEPEYLRAPSGHPYTWTVVTFEMPESSKAIRELAENGFSAAWGTPIRSVKEPNGRKARQPS